MVGVKLIIGILVPHTGVPGCSPDSAPCLSSCYHALWEAASEDSSSLVPATDIGDPDRVLGSMLWQDDSLMLWTFGE